jgi:hypothetical protein
MIDAMAIDPQIQMSTFAWTDEGGSWKNCLSSLDLSESPLQLEITQIFC